MRVESRKPVGPNHAGRDPDPSPAALLPGHPRGPPPGPLHLPALTRVAAGLPPSLISPLELQARGGRRGTRRAKEHPAPPRPGTWEIPAAAAAALPAPWMFHVRFEFGPGFRR
ncbi:unnamed protein product [Rangifer tarandus platyrhynchus]|uniref:Uncharacterized protein n=1 Tax=Rangifer tarandus platyrhynchus TaxID=3082113 RepID=A0AC59Z369_RANTA